MIAIIRLYHWCVGEMPMLTMRTSLIPHTAIMGESKQIVDDVAMLFLRSSSAASDRAWVSCAIKSHQLDIRSHRALILLLRTLTYLQGCHVRHLRIASSTLFLTRML